VAGKIGKFKNSLHNDAIFIWVHEMSQQSGLEVAFLVSKLVQWYLGLRVTWFASVLQDEQKCLINVNLIYERCLAI
jgi:hypothetical protein